MTVVRIVWGFFTLLVASVLGTLIAHDFGYVRIVYSGWALDTSLWAALAAVLFVFVIAYFLIKCIRLITHGESLLKGWVNQKQLSATKKQTQRALELEFNGDSIEAIRVLALAAAHSQHAELHYLRASEIADRIGADEQAIDLRDKAAKHAGKIGKVINEYDDALRLITAGEHRQGLRSLLRLLEEYPTCAPALEVVIDQLMAGEDWVGALEYLSVLERMNYASDESIHRLRVDCWKARLRQSESETVTTLWKSMPRKLRSEQGLIEQYVRTLVACEQHEEGARVLEKSLKNQWSSHLARLYGRVESDATKQIVVAESWLSEHPDDEGLLLTLAHLHRRLENSSKAIEFLNSCIRNGGGLEAHLELAEVNLKLGKVEQSQRRLVQAKTMLPESR